MAKMKQLVEMVEYMKREGNFSEEFLLGMTPKTLEGNYNMVKRVKERAAK